MQSPFLLLFKLSVTQVWRKSKQNWECESAATDFYKMAAMTSTIYANDLKLKSDHLDVCRANCAKFYWNRSSCFGCRAGTKTLHIQTDTHTDRQTDTQTDRQTDGQHLRIKSPCRRLIISWKRKTLLLTQRRKRKVLIRILMLILMICNTITL